MNNRQMSSDGVWRTGLSVAVLVCGVWGAGCSHVRPGVFMPDEVEDAGPQDAEAVSFVFAADAQPEEQPAIYPTFARGALAEAADDVFPNHRFVSPRAKGVQGTKVVIENIDVDIDEQLFGKTVTVAFEGYVLQGDKRIPLFADHAAGRGFTKSEGLLLAEAGLGAATLVLMFVPLVGALGGLLTGLAALFSADSSRQELQQLLDRAYSGAAVNFVGRARDELAGNPKVRRTPTRRRHKKKENRKTEFNSAISHPARPFRLGAWAPFRPGIPSPDGRAPHPGVG